MRPGYIMAPRALFEPENPLRKPGEAYDRLSAWLDLVSQASYAPGPYTTHFGADILSRSEFVASLNYLASRWRWRRNQVARFLKRCTTSGLLSGQRPGHHGTIYLVVNYDTYQGGGTETGTLTGTRPGQDRDQVEEVISKKVRIKRSRAPVVATISPAAQDLPAAPEPDAAAVPGTALPTSDPPKPSAAGTLPRGETRHTPKWGAASAFDLAPYIDAHVARFPGSDPPTGRYGRVFKRLEGKHGADETLRRWRNCLERKGTFATPEELAAHWSEYDAAEIPKPPKPDPFAHLAGYPNIIDEWGVFTEYGERLTRPDRLRIA